jgi:hypothetical protein
MVITRIVVTDPEDFARRLAWALMREGRFALPRADRKGPIRLSLDHCQEVAKLMVQELQAGGWVEAVFQGYDGRSVQKGHTGLAPKARDAEGDGGD